MILERHAIFKNHQLTYNKDNNYTLFDVILHSIHAIYPYIVYCIVREQNEKKQKKL